MNPKDNFINLSLAYTIAVNKLYVINFDDWFYPNGSVRNATWSKQVPEEFISFSYSWLFCMPLLCLSCTSKVTRPLKKA